MASLQSPSLTASVMGSQADMLSMVGWMVPEIGSIITSVSTDSSLGRGRAIGGNLPDFNFTCLLREAVKKNTIYSLTGGGQRVGGCSP